MLVGRPLEILHFASDIHKGQKRRSGEDYIQHVCRVAYKFTKMTPYNNTGSADKLIGISLLHDSIEDHPQYDGDIKSKYPDLYNHIIALTKRDRYDIYIHGVVESGPFPMLVKLSDLYDNMRNNNDNRQMTKYSLAKHYIETTLRLSPNYEATYSYAKDLNLL